MNTTEATKAADKLRELLPPGSTAHTVLRHISRSGMTRDISIIVTDNGQPWDISWLIGRLNNGWKINRDHGGIRVGGCGMDMGFHLVYSLSQYLHGDGYAIKQEWL